MTLVLDASVLVAALVQSNEAGAWAESVIARGTLAAPELVLAETANILRRLERARLVTAFESQSAFADMLRLDIEFFPFAPFANRVWALRENLTSHDAWYVSLSEALDCPLATTDKKLARSSASTCVFMLPPDGA